MEDANGARSGSRPDLEELAEGGVERVRVEVLATSLGVTKGGFYRRFKDRRALLDALLETWASGRIAAIEKQIELGGSNATRAARSLIRLYTERVSAQGIAIELAIRQWARSDAAAVAAVATRRRGAPEKCRRSSTATGLGRGGCSRRVLSSSTPSSSGRACSFSTRRPASEQA